MQDDASLKFRGCRNHRVNLVVVKPHLWVIVRRNFQIGFYIDTSSKARCPDGQHAVVVLGGDN